MRLLPAGAYVSQLLERCTFPPADTPVVAAVSGGPDSLALLALATAAGLEVTAVHVDHGMRPGSDQEARLVESVANRFGAKFEAFTVDVGPGPDLEARARQARYSVLPKGVLVGHTADDQLETVLLNFLRGAGLPGLAGMASGDNDWVQRPMLGLRRSETTELCRHLGLKPLQDPTNSDLRMRRNAIRHRLVPLAEEIAGRELAPIVARQAEVVRADSELLDELSADVDATDAKMLAAAPLPLARRAVRSWIRRLDPESHPPSIGAVNRVLSVARGEVVACELPGGIGVRRSAQRLYVQLPGGAADHASPGGTGDDKPRRG